MTAAKDARAERGDALEEATAEREAPLVVGADVVAVAQNEALIGALEAALGSVGDGAQPRRRAVGSARVVVIDRRGARALCRDIAQGHLCSDRRRAAGRAAHEHGQDRVIEDVGHCSLAGDARVVDFGDELRELGAKSGAPIGISRARE